MKIKKPIAIVAGEPNSISSEIIFKNWLLKSKYNHRPYIIIGSANLLNLQKKKMKYRVKIKEINENFKLNDLKNKYLPVYNVNYNQAKAFQKISVKSNNYIFDCFNLALKLIKKQKIDGFINCPISKETLFNNRYQGITEYISKKVKKNGSEVMLIYNKNLSVSPLTTHTNLKDVSRKINKAKIKKKIITINEFYKKILKKKPKFGILGFNPHNFSTNKKSEEKIISQSVKELKKEGINIMGPIPTDTSFMMHKKYKLDIIFGIYHDQVLTPFKALFNYDAINITLGLPFIRISPDHGISKDIVGKKIANPESLMESIKFFNKIN